MGTNIAILVGAVLIATTIAVTNHWQIAAATGDFWKLNRWTGEVSLCRRFDSGDGNPPIIQCK